MTFSSTLLETNSPAAKETFVPRSSTSFLPENAIPFSLLLKLSTAQLEGNLHQTIRDNTDELVKRDEADVKRNEKEALATSRPKRASWKEMTPEREPFRHGNNVEQLNAHKETRTWTHLSTLMDGSQGTPMAIPLVFQGRQTTFTSPEQIVLEITSLQPIALSKQSLSELFQKIAVNSPVPEVPFEEIVSEIVEKAYLVKKQGEVSFLLQLHPQDLGKILIRMTQQEQGLSIQIVAAEEKTRKLLVAEQHQLLTKLSEQKQIVQALTIASCNPNETLLEWPANLTAS